MNFPCTSCSACCRRIHLLPTRGLDPKYYFPKEYIGEDGKTCNKLGENGECTIYDKRPVICRVKSMHKPLSKLKKTQEGLPNPMYGISLKDFYRVNGAICNQWQEEDGIDESFRVHISASPEGR